MSSMLRIAAIVIATFSAPICVSHTAFSGCWRDTVPDISAQYGGLQLHHLRGRVVNREVLEGLLLQLWRFLPHTTYCLFLVVYQHATEAFLLGVEHHQNAIDALRHLGRRG